MLDIFNRDGQVFSANKMDHPCDTRMAQGIMKLPEVNSIQLFIFSQTIIINTQVNNNMQIIENIHNLRVGDFPKPTIIH